MKYKHLNEISRYFKPVDYIEDTGLDIEKKLVRDGYRSNVRNIIDIMDNVKEVKLCMHMRSGTTAELRTIRLENSCIAADVSVNDKFSYVMMNAFATLFQYIKNSSSERRQNLKYDPEMFFIKVKMKDDSERNINLLYLDNDKIDSIKNILWSEQYYFRIDDLSAEILERSIRLNICFYYMDDDSTVGYFMNLYGQYLHLKQSGQSEKAKDYADYPTVQIILDAIKSYKAKYNVTDEEILRQYFDGDNKNTGQYSADLDMTQSRTRLTSRILEEIIKVGFDKNSVASRIKSLKDNMENMLIIPVTLNCEYKLYTKDDRKSVKIAEFAA